MSIVKLENCKSFFEIRNQPGDLFAPPVVCLLAPLGCSGTSWRLSSLTVRTAMAEVNDELGFGLFELIGFGFLELLTLRTFPSLVWL